MKNHSQYKFLYPDEVRGLGNGPSSPIPTFGAATSAIDLYRTVAAATTNLPDVRCAFTDVCAVAALARVAEGRFTDVAELEAAETALSSFVFQKARRNEIFCVWRLHKQERL